MADVAHRIAQCVFDTYRSLPTNGKPTKRSNGAPQWTVLSSFCLVSADEQDPVPTVKCISLGTGLKALPHAKLPVHGDVLHDSHAEIIARRGLLLWLYSELSKVVAGQQALVEATRHGAWKLAGGRRLVMYVSTLPCGDASTWFLAQQAAESDIESEGVELVKCTEGARSGQLAEQLGMSTQRDDQASVLQSKSFVQRGRTGWSTLSTLRTKPGRLDSPPTTSHSCSDKVLRWQLLGCQGALLSSLGFEPLYIDTLVIGGVGMEQRMRVGQEVGRALWQRGERAGARSIDILFCDNRFEHARDVVAEAHACPVQDVVSCQESLSYVAEAGCEIIVNGIRQGASTKRRAEQALAIKSRSRISKLSLFERHQKLAARLQAETAGTGSETEAKAYQKTYHQTKQTAREYAHRKRALLNSDGSQDEAPLRGWLVCGVNWESFDQEGRVVSNMTNVAMHS
ncbi:hypothetical protein OIO90_002986 [Microbotryomycetes sp. JL221]|nr:hypothetical protein OIO90_002986 [Microbotryomycetes sp. JL221]